MTEIEENKFLYAIDNKEVDLFLLGENLYFEHGNEWSGGYEIHDSGSSFGYIKNSILQKILEEKRVYEILEQSLINLLQKEKSANFIFEVLLLLWRCFSSYRSGFFHNKWVVSDELTVKIKECLSNCHKKRTK